MSEGRLRRVLDAAPDPIWVWDGERLCFVNRCAPALFGYADEASFHTVPPIELVHPEERMVLRRRAEQLFAGKEPVEPRLYRFLRRDGSLLWLEVQSIVTDWEGRPAILSIGRDVTARREMEARLAQADRLAALGTLVAGLAHELNSPIAYALLGLEQAFALVGATAEGPARSNLEARLGEIRDGVERTSAIVQQLKTFARPPAPERTTRASVRAPIEAALRLARAELARRGQVVVELFEAPAVVANPSRLEQVFLNLLVNAAHALPEDRVRENVVVVRLTTGDDGGACVEIRDNGCGIAADVLPRIFDPFFTTKPTGVGTGLGLAISHDIVRAHGGTIEVESAPGTGTCFRVRLPAANAEPAARPTPNAATPEPTSRKAADVAGDRPAPAAPEAHRPRVLIVDDEPLLAEMLARMLGDRFATEAMTDSRTALDRLGRGPRIDFVVCDVMMPGLTGLDVYEAAVRRDPTLARGFVFMTGGAYLGPLADRIDALRSPRIEKPFPVAALARLLASLASGTG